MVWNSVPATPNSTIASSKLASVSKMKAKTPGMQYMINVHVDNPAWRHMPIRSISSGQAIILADVSIDGSHIKHKKRGDIQYNFVFDTPLIVSDGGISDKHATDKIRTIEVSFRNERAKKGALISSTTRFSLAAPRHTPRWSTAPYSRDLRVGHTFHYKTEDFLEMEGIIPGPNPADANATPVETNAEHAKIEAKKEENEEEDAIEFVSSTPVVKRTVELVDLTTTTSEPKRRGRTSSSSTVIDVDAPVVVKREKSFTGKRESKVQVIDLT
ncbi:hypothetical protein HDU78_008521 [Chytriomyces hyalinus]|nr:hypothetical protein HDU78_008521 [Chytriomyces hyalinus]